MLKVFDRYLEKKLSKKKTIEIRNFKSFLRSFFDPKTTSNCLQCEAGPKHPVIAVDISGSIYPCDYLWEERRIQNRRYFRNIFNRNNELQ